MRKYAPFASGMIGFAVTVLAILTHGALTAPPIV